MTKKLPINGIQYLLKNKGTYFCGDRLKPCKCGADNWQSLGDKDCGDWEEEQFQCLSCGKVIYCELPD